MMCPNRLPLSLAIIDPLADVKAGSTQIAKNIAEIGNTFFAAGICGVCPESRNREVV